MSRLAPTVDLDTMPETPLKLIAHRGNIDGRQPYKENHPDYIDHAIHLGYDVEVDVWGQEGRFGLDLGHDGPVHPIDFSFIEKRIQHLWVHAKGPRALYLIREYLPSVRYFFHQTDDYTITSWQDIWCYPGKPAYGSHAIVLLPEQWMELDQVGKYCQRTQAAGVCSDFVGQIKSIINT